MAILKLAFRSLLNRRFTALLTLSSIALSVMLLLGVERLRQDARESFTHSLSGTDLIVGARTGSVQLLLYTVFHLGNATNNISWKSYQEIAQHKSVAWTLPISLGDSHKGFRVIGTNAEIFDVFRYGQKQSLVLKTGAAFSDLLDAVIGAEVARKLGYQIDDRLILAHGTKDVAFARHQDKPFRVSGILKTTGTPLDRSILVSLPAIEAIHADWQNGAPQPGVSFSAAQVRQMELQPKTITAALIGLNSRLTTFKVQRFVNDYRSEPLTAILPGVALSELWDLVGAAEKALILVSGFVVVVGLAGLLTSLLTSLTERRREMAILRSVGARPAHIIGLISGEALIMTLIGVGLGMALMYGLAAIMQPLILEHLGIQVTLNAPDSSDYGLLGVIVLAGFIVGLIPGISAYRTSLADGLTTRL